MRLTLKNLKINQALSEETLCFSASLYLDGKRVGTVGNRGCGGANETHVLPEYRTAVREAAEALRESATREWRASGLMLDYVLTEEDLLTHLCDLELDAYEDKKALKKLQTARALKYGMGTGRIHYLALHPGDDPDVIAAKHVPVAAEWKLVTA